MKTWVICCVVGITVSAHAQVGPIAVDRVAEKQALIAKLTSDINKVDHAIRVTKELIKSSTDAPYLATLYFRLAELYVEKSRYTYVRVMEQLPAGETSLSGDKSLEVQITKRLAIETYDKILSEFPEYSKNDEVRFFKAHERRELGEWDVMLKEYRALVSRHPKSPWAIEARAIIGDYHFDKGELGPAEEMYQEILKLSESHMHDMARYKMGWIRINQDKHKEALAYFEGAVRSKTKTRKGAVGDASSIDVKREALVAMVWPYSEVRKASQARNYFETLAGSKTEYLTVLRKLANRYFIKTQYSSAAYLYREIVRLSANVEQNVDFIQRIYDSVRNMSSRNPARYAKAADDVDAIVKTLAAFENHIAHSKEDSGPLKKDLEVRARDLATRLHAEAKRGRSTSKAKIAAEAYRKYLSLFDHKKFRRKMQVNRAEALYQATDYLRAGLQYEEVAKKLPRGEKQRKDVYEAILSYHKALDEEAVFREKHPTKDGPLDKLALLRAREGMKQLGAYYVKNWPKNSKVPTVKFNIAKMYYQQGAYERSTELFRAFVKQYPTHKDMSVAGNLALDGLHKLDDYDGMVAVAKEFVDNRKIRDRRFKNEVARIAEAARKRKVEYTVVAAGDGEFSERMLEEWEKHQGTEQGEEFLYTAFVKYKGEGNIAGVFDFGGRLIGAYPKSKRLADVLATMGNFALRGADFERAAFLFEEFYRRFPKEKNAVSVMASAANIRFFLGMDEEAAKDYRVLRSKGGRAVREEAHERLMEVYANAGDWAALGRVAKTAVAADGRGAAGRAYLGLAYLERGKLDLAEREFRRAASGQANSAFAQAAQGRAAFALGQIYQRRYEGVQFRDAGSAEAVLNQKIQLMGALEEAYVSAIGSGTEWAIAALYEASRAYRDFADFLANAPVPGGLSKSERDQYKKALQDQAAPHAAKATETRRACAQKAEQLVVFSSYAAACIAGSEARVEETGRRPNRGGRDDAYVKELAALRTELAKQPENIALLKKVARRAMQEGDYHLARMTLLKAAENDPRNGALHNLLGVCHWSLGKAQEAYAAFGKARSMRSRPAVLNLAALFAEFGYDTKARQAFKASGGIGGEELSSVDFHTGRLQDGRGVHRLMRAGWVIIGLWGAGCGALSHTVDRDTLARLTIENKLLLFDAENDVSIAIDEKDKIQRELQLLREDRDDAFLQLRDAETDADRASEKGDEQRYQLAQRSGQVTELKLAYFDAYRDYLKERLFVQEDLIHVALAKYELAKAQLVKRNNLEGASDVDLADFEQQVDDVIEDAKDSQRDLKGEKQHAQKVRDVWLEARQKLSEESGGGFGSPWAEDGGAWGEL